jgi:hypothetical protein
VYTGSHRFLESINSLYLWYMSENCKLSLNDDALKGLKSNFLARYTLSVLSL